MAIAIMKGPGALNGTATPSRALCRDRSTCMARERGNTHGRRSERAMAGPCSGIARGSPRGDCAGVPPRPSGRDSRPGRQSRSGTPVERVGRPGSTLEALAQYDPARSDSWRPSAPWRAPRRDRPGRDGGSGPSSVHEALRRGCARRTLVRALVAVVRANTCCRRFALYVSLARATLMSNTRGGEVAMRHRVHAPMSYRQQPRVTRPQPARLRPHRCSLSCHQKPNLRGQPTLRSRGSSSRPLTSPRPTEHHGRRRSASLALGSRWRWRRRSPPVACGRPGRSSREHGRLPATSTSPRRQRRVPQSPVRAPLPSLEPRARRHARRARRRSW